MRAQAAVEYLAIVAISLAILVPLWIYVSSSNENVRQDLTVAYARQVVYKLKDAADVVFVQGAPAQLSVDVSVPSGITYASASGREILLRVDSGGGTTDVYSVTLGNVTGALASFATTPGSYFVLVKAQEDALGNVFVNITA